MSLPATLAAARRSLLLMAQQRSSITAAATAAAAASPPLRRFFSSSGGGGQVVEVSDDAALAKALDACAANGAGSVVNYTAVWCGPCKAMAKPQQDLAKQYPGVSFLKVDIDSPALQASVAAAGVSAVPTYVVRKGAQVIDTIQGARLELLQKAVAQAAGK
jgi:thioredoxin 1